MMNGAFKFDPSRFYRASREMAQLARKKPLQDVFKNHAGQFVRKIASVTPPAQAKKSADGKIDWSKPKKSGEQMIKNDLAKLMVAAAARLKRALESAAELHASNRNPRTGRVSGRKRRPLHAVARNDLMALKKKLLSHVGLLASGWNTAAQKLGVALPAWITRHGTGHGMCRITATQNGVRITIGNAVGFVGNVKDLERRMQWALDSTADSLNRQLAATVAKQARAAGFKSR